MESTRQSWFPSTQDEADSTLLFSLLEPREGVLSLIQIKHPKCEEGTSGMALGTVLAAFFKPPSMFSAPFL